ncbi:multidrug resistance-associated protein 3 [Wolffia australiana]
MGFFFYLRALSASFHLALLLLLSAVWFRRVCRRGSSCKSDHGRRFRLYPAALLSSTSLALLSLPLAAFNLLRVPPARWSREELAMGGDLAARALSWTAISAYSWVELPRREGRRFPAFLRVWWLFFLFMSASFLLLDVIQLDQNDVPIHVWAEDIGSLLFGVILAYAALRGGREEAHDGGESREPLLNGGAVAAESPFSSAGVWSLVTFSWMNPLFSVGYRTTLDLNDVPSLAANDTVDGVFPVFSEKLDAYAGGSSEGVRTVHLTKALVFSSWPLVLWTAFCALVYTGSSYVGPWLIDSFVQFLNGRGRTAGQGYFLVGGFIAAKILEGLSQRYWFFSLQQAGIRVRACLAAGIYQKGISLSNSARQGRTSGEIINLMSVDADRVGMFTWYMHDLWMVPIQVGLALAILYANLGTAALAALAATVVVMLANLPLGKMQERYQERLMAAKDTRMKTMAEILRNMRILKLQAWEMKFLSRVTELREKEASWLKRYVYTSAMITFAFWGAPTVVSVATFATCMLMGVPLESGKVLSALATFRVLQEPIYNLPDTVSMVIQTKVSLDRLAEFLRLEELRDDVVEKLPAGGGAAVEVEEAAFSWDPSAEEPTLKDLNFEIRRGMTVAVCGGVGAGKSTLLAGILGEVPKTSGCIRLHGTTAYVSQSPWIQSGKIEENILFGKAMERSRYERVLEACSLNKDLEILPFGDQTVIGERGINLSGGQKQRIQIARALYHDADVFLFDDPFSAVDAHTGSHLFKECLLGMLATKTVIFVTHQVEFLPSADLILVMKNGRITQAGKYQEILRSGTEFMELVSAHREALSALDSVDISGEGEVAASGDAETHLKKKKKTQSEDIRVEQGGKSQQLVQDEEREKGRVEFAVYWKYLTTAYKGALVPFILGAQILFQGLQIASNYWMAWAAPPAADAPPPVSSLVLIVVYVGLAMGSSLFVLCRAMLVATAGYKTATLLFHKMHACIFRAPMAFFDATPSGRILNRASTDQSEVDTSFAPQIGSFAFSVIQLLGIVAVMSQVAWQVFIVFIPAIAVCVWYQQYYIATARELARLVGVCKAPIIQHFAESLSGSTTIRSFDQRARFVETNFHLNDKYSRPKFHNAAAMEWLCLRLDALATAAFAFSLVFLVSIPVGSISPAIAGVAVTYGLNLNMIQSWVIWNLCNLENKIISVERILQYTSIPSEPPLAVEGSPAETSWPSRGEVDLRGLQVRYAPRLPLVLRGLTCVLPGGKKTGIVGRTGSGKSTLIQALFRIVEAAAGEILIDGRNIATVGLHDLRSRLGIIPQDPTMFEGTLRSNLDPLEEHSDEAVWQALDRCQLGDQARKRGALLDSAVTENGENWSVGQRQLVCLGRVILKKSKILVLDEATASVDTATDGLIQRTLRLHFSGSTVLTIAHRITSVLDSDMVLVLDNGAIAEFDSPARLLENKSSMFAKLVAEYSARSSSSFQF